MIGTRLAHYEITGHLGSGGMGEVYRATDSRLGRSVAIKLLPEAFLHDAERAARFEREARVLAALNHPNIAAIHGVEESGGRKFLVMELVEGDTIADRIARGPIPIDEVLQAARELADGLEAAHENGIVHRDLKPANVKVTPQGQVKILDFGLAKALDQVTGSGLSGQAQGSRPTAQGGVTNSPTITSPAMTQAGMILGTAAYMSPEQARGRAVDKRTDIWAFGCVLYEMLTGRRAFDGEDVTEIVGAVIHKTPDVEVLPSDTPQAVRTALRLCLVKDPKRRLRDAGDLRLVLDGTLDSGDSRPAAFPASRPAWILPAFAGTGLAFAALLGVTVWWLTRPGPPPLPAMFEVGHTGPLPIGGTGADIVITPDGRRVAYLAGPPGKKQIVVRALDRLESVVLGPAGQFGNLFVSPDSQWIGYTDAVTRSVMKISVTGGAPITLCRDLLAIPTVGAWSSDDLIVFGMPGGAPKAEVGLWSVPAAGGTPQKILAADASRSEVHGRPEFLPGGQTLLFDTGVAAAPIEELQIEAFDLRTGTRKVVLRGGSHPHYTSSGHLVYATTGALRAVRFDATNLEIVGTSVQVLEGLVTKPARTASFSLAPTGTAVYIKGGITQARRTVVWVDRNGREELVGVPTRAYAYAVLSPDNERIALDSRDENLDIWIWQRPQKTMTRLTLDPGLNRSPVWVPPDGRRIAFSSTRDGVEQGVWQAADGSSPAEPITTEQPALVPQSFSPDGRWLLMMPGIQPFDMYLMDLQATPRRPRLMAATPFNDLNGEISPDGRWLAYQSNESGRYEVYVRPFPDVTTARWVVSTAGGTRPAWSHDGRELFYATAQASGADGVSVSGEIMSVPVRLAPTFTFGSPKVVVKSGYVSPFAGRSYDVGRDGRFLMIKDVREPGEVDRQPQIVLVEHWLEELKRLVY